jgi:hypothetical protein
MRCGVARRSVDLGVGRRKGSCAPCADGSSLPTAQQKCTATADLEAVFHFSNPTQNSAVFFTVGFCFSLIVSRTVTPTAF